MARLLENTIGAGARVGLAGHEANHQALLNGDIDLYAEYLGTALRRYLGRAPRKSAPATYRAVRDGARERWGVEWLPAFGFNNTYALVVRRDLAQKLSLSSVTDLASAAQALRLGGTEEFLAPDSKVTFAPGGFDGLRAAYDLAFGSTVPLSASYGATFAALGTGEVDAVVDFPVNPRMISLDLVELHDDHGFFAPYFAAPVVSGNFLAAHPEARATLERLAGRIDNRRAAKMNHAVELEGIAPETVAADLLAELSVDPPAADRGRRASRRRVG